MADIIAERRKEKGMTQKQLADKLGVTDKAVSKWERGNGQPDINYLEPLSEALEITVSELLKGKRDKQVDSSVEEDSGDEEIVKTALSYANSVYKARSVNIPRIVLLSILALGLVGIITTSIVDFALNGSFTWSLLPISGIIYLWLCIIPLFLFGKRRVDIALLSTSVFLLPFLYIICRLTGGDWFSTLAIPMSISGVVILWLIRAVFATKLSIWNKLAVSGLVLAVGNVVISFQIGVILSEGGFDIWNLMSVAILVVAAGILFVIGLTRKITKLRIR
ncbi:MAG: helix-turn-helix domain-containing protein [Oscillospiraceae bacterium]